MAMNIFVRMHGKLTSVTFALLNLAERNAGQINPRGCKVMMQELKEYSLYCVLKGKI